MPIDPTGTAPGTTPQGPGDDTVNMKCSNPNCHSMTAVVVPIGESDGVVASPVRMYRCTKCNHMRGVNVGGVLNI